ncbi:hypothetical protein E4U13_004820 [Claviceps humidiphila]|uniref:Transcription regulator BDF1 n=1 Tax=Claviceps humidiphila TaxID=1294629 RepID=A0A9P7PWX9_9HYPO|nr:hypothetical protein E4U13_004820 [Claviceps humidiphila]
MSSPGADAPVLDPKSNMPVREKNQDGQKSELPGHSADGAPKSDSPSESKSDSLSRPAVTGEKPTEVVPVPNNDETGETAVASDSMASDSMASDKQAHVPNGVDAGVKKDMKPSASEDTPMHDAPAIADGTTSKLTDPEDNKGDKKSDESSDKENVDTEMTDLPALKTKSLDAVASEGHDTRESATAQDAPAPPTSDVDLGPASMSQLAIETTEKSSPVVEASGDVPMTDAPSAKVSRERYEDEGAAIDEPASKRARTEPKDEQPAASAPAQGETQATVSVAETPGLNLSALTKLSNWADEETNKRPISAFQRREMRKIVGRIRKTKAGGHFRESVQKLWPGLWDSYVVKVPRPMDLAELDRGLRDPAGPYHTYGEFRKDLGLIFENALNFNGPLHDITASGATAVKAIWEEVLPIPSEEPPKPRAMPKPKPVRESRVIGNTEQFVRPQFTGPRASSAVDAISSSKGTAATPHDQAAADRRSSTATEGDRPKRTVRAPKPKDIDYSTKPSRKKLKPELQFAEEVLNEIMAGRHHDMNQWFMDPVDAEGLNIPDYYSVIKKPMDLNKVSRMLSGGEISSLREFEKTVRLIFDNCFKFNGPVGQGNPVSVLAKRLEDLFLTQLKGKDAWLAKHAKYNAPAAASIGSDEDEDDEDEDGEDATVAVIDSKEIEELQAKLDEETKKLNSMLLTSNQSMIDIQKNIVDMVQKTLIAKAQEVQAARARAKNDRSKKSGKGGKSKSGGTSGGRKSIGGAAKKSGGSKKITPRKSLTAAQKDLIANGINDLEFPYMDRAIDIIKKDTGQNENNDGELELDIDQLSHDALCKLWDICRKAVPGFARDMEPLSAPEASRPSAKAGSKASTAAKPKKNKPMSASEQEQRIAELQALSQMYKNPQEASPGVTQAPTPGAESSDDSDSEEE